jgi:hypothetical protein
VVTTRISAAGSPKMLSNAFRSWRISVLAEGACPGDGVTPGGGVTGAAEDEAGSRTVTVSPRPSVPLLSRGWMPYATWNTCGA